MFFDRLKLMLVHGPRGGGKSFLASLTTHLDSQVYPGHGTKILGGSLAQSGQIYQALREFDDARPDDTPFTSFSRTQATYHNGSEVAILAASETSVRGPHVPRVFLDEVDEIQSDIREHAAGIAMSKNGIPSSVVMLSTWHRVGGPMTDLVKKAESGKFKAFSFCVFDVLERCPDKRSGRNLEKCPQCAIMKWCHEGKEFHNGLPKAKRSDGHYKIDDLIQKTSLTSLPVFEADFLCLRPRSGGIWFTDFDENLHISEDAEYDPGRPFHVSVDPGVRTAGIWFQTAKNPDGSLREVNVFGDYFMEDMTAEANALNVIHNTYELTNVGTQAATVSMDPISNKREGIGVTIRAEYQRVGCVGRDGKIKFWPSGQNHSKVDTLAMVQALMKSAVGEVNFRIHPRCTYLKMCFQTYVRAKRSGQWADFPEDPQHPQENGIDALAGGICFEAPKGRRPKERLKEVSSSIIY